MVRTGSLCTISNVLSLLTVLILICQTVCEVDFITDLAAFRGRRSYKSKLECLFPTEYSGRCITSPKSGRDICYPDLAMLDYSCVSKNLNGRRSVPPPRVQHGQYKALITSFRPPNFRPEKNGHTKPFLVVQYQCNPGYEFLDEAEYLFCRENSWLNTSPVCVPSEFANEYRKKDNPCQENNGDCSHICRHLGGGVITCECPAGMNLDVEDSRTCKEMDLCQVNNGGCSHFCINADEPGASPRCLCPEGFTIRADSKTCIEEAFNVSEFLPDKPGVCPQIAFGWPDQKCASNCRRDQECPGKQKCCNNGCAAICISPEPGTDLIEKPIGECTTTEGCRCEIFDEARQRCTCPKGLICYLTRSAPDVTISPQGPIEVRPGAPLNLTCNAGGFPYPNVSWFRDNAPMAQANGILLEKTMQKRLVVKELFKSTVFSCEAVNDVGATSAEITVIVTGPGSPPGNIQAKVSGTSVAVRWTAPTLPNGQIKGYQIYYIATDVKKPLREWKTVGTVEPRVTITDLQPLTRYFLRIVPYNERGSGIMTNIFSVRTEKLENPPTALIVEGSVVEVEPGESVNLTCRVEGHPPASVAWYQNGNRLQEAEVVPSLTTTFENALETSVFECRASNARGFANSSVRVEVIYPGDAPRQIQYRVDGVNVEISWGAPEYPNGEIQGYTLHYTTDPNLPLDQWEVEIVQKKQSMILTNLIPGATYFGRIRAFNERGSGPLSETLTVITGKKNVKPTVRVAQQTVQIEPYGQFNGTCVASGIPEPTITWKQDGEQIRSFFKQGPGENDVSKTIVIERIVESTTFTCEATNDAGSASIRVDILVTGPGSPPENIDVSTDETTINLRWQEPIIPNGLILGYHIYFTTNRTLPLANWHKFTVPSSGFQSQAIMHDLLEDATYFIRINGFTNLGEGIMSQVYQVRTSRKSAHPKVTLQPTAGIISIVQGETYEVVCTATGFPDPTFAWFRDGEPVGYRTIFENARMVAAVLTVENVLKTSLFECRAVNSFGTASKELIVDVKGPGTSPKNIRYLPYSTNIDMVWAPPEIPNGQIIGYDIVYTIEPEEDVSQWYKVNIGPKLQHKLLGLAPNKHYTVKIRAINEKGPGPWSPAFSVDTGNAEAPPEVNLTPEGPTFHVAPGDSLNITCKADGFPLPIVELYEHGQRIPHDEASEVTVMKEHIYESFLFECKAVSVFGVSSKLLHVEVAGPGEPPLRFEVRVKGTTIEASWLPPRITNGVLTSFVVYYTTNPGLDIGLWEMIQVPVKPEGESPFYDIVITSLLPNTTYHLKSQAISSKGPGVVTEAVTVKTVPLAYSINVVVIPEGTLYIPTNGGVQLNCSATGYPTPMVTWRKADHPISSPQPNFNVLFIDGVSGPVNLECYAESDAGNVVKVAYIFPSEQLEKACKPKASLDEGHYFLTWPTLLESVKSNATFVIHYTTKQELPLDKWATIETAHPTLVHLPSLQGGQRYYARIRIKDMGGLREYVCGMYTNVAPTLPKVVTLVKAKNGTLLVWSGVKIPDEVIEVYVHYTYELNAPFEDWETVAVEATANEVLLPNIRAGIEYAFKLEFITDKQESIISTQYIITSPEIDECDNTDCEQLCTVDKEDNLPKCACRPGFVLNEDQTTCSLVAKPSKVTTTGPSVIALGKGSCQEDNGGCEQLCEETSNKMIKCSCTEGFVLDSDLKSCEEVQRASISPTKPSKPGDICQMPLDPGPCDKEIASWHYESSTDECYMFNYGGCEGNANRFSSKEECLDKCSGKMCHKKRNEAIKQQKSYLPECDENGDFLSSQCDNVGSCWCVNTEDGMEISGSRYTAEQGRPYCKSCLLEWHRRAGEGKIGSFIPSCTPEGLYDQVQCHASVGMCWCVDQMTGTEIMGTRVKAPRRISCVHPPEAKPEKVRVVLIEDKLKFTFALPPNATAKKFILHFSPDPNLATNKWQVIEINQPFTNTGFERPNFLLPNSTYTFKITPVLDVGVGVCSEVVTIDTTVDIPPQPPKIRVENLQLESVLLKWDRDPLIDTPDVEHYNVYITEKVSGKSHRIHRVHAYDEILLTVKPGILYSVYITSVNEAGESPHSNAVEFTTPTKDGQIVTTTISLIIPDGEISAEDSAEKGQYELKTVAPEALTSTGKSAAASTPEEESKEEIVPTTKEPKIIEGERTAPPAITAKYPVTEDESKVTFKPSTKLIEKAATGKVESDEVDEEDKATEVTRPSEVESSSVKFAPIEESKKELEWETSTKHPIVTKASEEKEDSKTTEAGEPALTDSQEIQSTEPSKTLGEKVTETDFSVTPGVTEKSAEAETSGPVESDESESTEATEKQVSEEKERGATKKTEEEGTEQSTDTVDESVEVRMSTAKPSITLEPSESEEDGIYTGEPTEKPDVKESEEEIGPTEESVQTTDAGVKSTPKEATDKSASKEEDVETKPTDKPSEGEDEKTEAPVSIPEEQPSEGKTTLGYLKPDEEISGDDSGEKDQYELKTEAPEVDASTDKSIKAIKATTPDEESEEDIVSTTSIPVEEPEEKEPTALGAEDITSEKPDEDEEKEKVTTKGSLVKTTGSSEEKDSEEAQTEAVSKRIVGTTKKPTEKESAEVTTGETAEQKTTEEIETGKPIATGPTSTALAVTKEESAEITEQPTITKKSDDESEEAKTGEPDIAIKSTVAPAESAEVSEGPEVSATKAATDDSEKEAEKPATSKPATTKDFEESSEEEIVETAKPDDGKEPVKPDEPTQPAVPVTGKPKIEIVSKASTERAQTLQPIDQVKDTVTFLPAMLPEHCRRMAGPMDIVFILDLSDQASRRIHAMAVDDLAKIVDNFFVIESAAVKVGFIQYSSAVDIVVPLGDYANKVELLQRIERSQHRKGGSVTAEALKAAKTMFESNGRDTSAQIVLLITDGRSSSDPRQAGKDLVDIGVQIVAVGIGSNVNEDYLASLESDDTRGFYASDVESFNDEVLPHVILQICNFMEMAKKTSPDKRLELITKATVPTEDSEESAEDAETKKPDDVDESREPTAEARPEPTSELPAKPRESTVATLKAVDQVKAVATTIALAFEGTCKTDDVPTDVIFVLDLSNQIKSDYHTLAVDLITRLIERYEVNPAGVRVGFIQYSDKVEVTVRLGDYADKNDLVDKIRKSEHLRSAAASVTVDALSETKKMFETSTSPEAQQKIVLLITDGYETIDPRNAILDLRHQGRVLVVGIGPGVEESYIERLNTQRAKGVFVNDIRSLFTDNTFETIAPLMCDNVELVGVLDATTHGPIEMLPGATIITNATFVGVDSIAVRWRVKEKDTNDWIFVIVYTDDTAKRLEITIPGHRRETILTNVPGKKYAIVVYATNKNGRGVSSAEIVISRTPGAPVPTFAPETSEESAEIAETEKPDEPTVISTLAPEASGESVEIGETEPPVKPSVISTPAPEKESEEDEARETGLQKTTKSGIVTDDKEEDDDEHEVGLTSPTALSEDKLKSSPAAPSTSEPESDEEEDRTSPDEEGRDKTVPHVHTSPKPSEGTSSSEEIEDESKPPGAISVRPPEISGEVEGSVEREKKPTKKPVGGVTPTEGPTVKPSEHVTTESKESGPIIAPDSGDVEIITELSTPEVGDVDVRTEEPIGFETEEVHTDKPALETSAPDSQEEAIVSKGPMSSAKPTDDKESEEESTTFISKMEVTPEASSGEVSVAPEKKPTTEEESDESSEEISAASHPPTPPTPYEKFTTSIPAKDLELAPRCNCTCRVVVKSRRRGCYYDVDDSSEVEVLVDGKRKKAKECNDTNGHDEHLAPYEVDQTPLEPVPEDKESECPCVIPLRGDMCPPGYSLKFGKCRDINECAYKNGGCSHGCVNTVGGYYCACPPGMHRDVGDPKICLAQDAYFKRLGQMLYHHLWNKAKSANGRVSVEPVEDNALQARYSQHPKNANRAVARISNGTNTMKLEWEWANFLKKKLKH